MSRLSIWKQLNNVVSKVDVLFLDQMWKGNTDSSNEENSSQKSDFDGCNSVNIVQSGGGG